MLTHSFLYLHILQAILSNCFAIVSNSVFDIFIFLRAKLHPSMDESYLEEIEKDKDEKSPLPKESNWSADNLDDFINIIVNNDDCVENWYSEILNISMMALPMRMLEKSWKDEVQKEERLWTSLLTNQETNLKGNGNIFFFYANQKSTL